MPKKVTLSTLYLVIARYAMDDFPLLITPDGVYARKYAKNVPQADIDAAKEVMEVDASVPVNVAVVRFKDGRPKALKIVRDLTEEQPETAPEDGRVTGLRTGGTGGKR